MPNHKHSTYRDIHRPSISAAQLFNCQVGSGKKQFLNAAPCGLPFSCPVLCFSISLFFIGSCIPFHLHYLPEISDKPFNYKKNTWQTPTHKINLNHHVRYAAENKISLIESHDDFGILRHMLRSVSDLSSAETVPQQEEMFTNSFQ